MIESKIQLHKKVILLQKEIDMYKSRAQCHVESQFQSHMDTNEISEYVDAGQLEINDYSRMPSNL